MNRKQFILAFMSLLLVGPAMAEPLFKYVITKVSDGPILEVTRGKTYLFEIQGLDINDQIPTSGAESLMNITLSGPSGTILAPTGGNPYTPDPTGKLSLLIRWNAAPGDASITVRHNTNPSISGSLSGIKVQPFVQSFDIALPDGLDTTAGTLFRVTITALDSGGGTVTSFKDTITLSDDFVGDIVTILGSNFVNGVNTTNVSLIAGDWNTHINHVKARNTVLYNGQSTIATGTSNNINVRPAAYDRILLIFPGETPTPGIAPGKTGAPIAQVAEASISPVQVFATDPYYNQLVSGYPTGLTVTLNSSIGADTIPGSMALVSNPLDLSGLVTFHAPLGNRTITATPNINIGNTSQSIVVANPGAVAYYRFTQQPAESSVMVADVPFSLQITAYDAGNNVQTQVNGPVVGTLSANLLPSFDGGTKYVDTNSLTTAPDNTITFTNGVATITNRLLVTREWNNVNLTFNDGKVAPITSNTFRVVPGTPKQVVMTILGVPGQTFTPGQYPGNSGTPPAITAGQNVLVEMRLCDGRWNVVTGALVDATSVTLLGDTGPTPRYISVLGGSGGTFDFPATGVIFGASVATVTFNTAATQVIRGQTGGSFSFLSNSSQIQVNPGSYSRLMLIGPGETAHPGIPSTIQADGKVGSVTSQLVGELFTLRVVATDNFWNPINVAVFPLIHFDFEDPDHSITPPTPLIMGGASESYSVKLKSLTKPQIRVYDVNEPSKTQTISVNTIPGVVHHFRFIPSIAADKYAGIAFNATIQAEDIYDNVVTSANMPLNIGAQTGLTTISPVSISITNGLYNGSFTLFTATSSTRISMSSGTITSYSSPITVQTHPEGYKTLLMLLPGETATPGMNFGTTGKIGSPSATTVGALIPVEVMACDKHFNPVYSTNTVVLNTNSNLYANFFPKTGNMSLFDGKGKFTSSVQLRTAALHSLTASDANLPSAISHSTSIIQGLVGFYQKVQLLAPGQTADPGTDKQNGVLNANITPQRVGAPFTVIINAVDEFWNVVPTYNQGDIVFSADTNAIVYNPPNKTLVSDPNRNFVSGTATREIIIGTQSAVALTADDNNSPSTVATIIIPMIPGPQYVVNLAVPPVVHVDEPFGLTVTLEEGGIPVPGYNEPIYISAVLRSNLQPARGTFPNSQFNMNNGSVTISNLSHHFVEDILIRIQDNLGRVTYSDPINVLPNGLQYRVSGDISAVAGPPADFRMRVELLENNGTLVTNRDHSFDITALTGNPATSADGVYKFLSGRLNGGISEIRQTYTKAEVVQFAVSESTTDGDLDFDVLPFNSYAVDVRADRYFRLLILAPGEVHRPGDPRFPLGKDSSLKSVIQPGTPFNLNVLAVDPHWNIDLTYSGGNVELDSNDIPKSIDPLRPENHSAFTNGRTNFPPLQLFVPGDITLSAFDLIMNDPSKKDAVSVTVSGNKYQVLVNYSNPQYSNTPFSMSVRVVDAQERPIVNVNHEVEIFAYSGNQLANGTLSVQGQSLFITNGVLNIPSLTYSNSENISIVVQQKTTNSVKLSGRSEIISFVPFSIDYQIQIPSQAQVETDFTVTITALDHLNGSRIMNIHNREVFLSARSNGFSPITGNLNRSSVVLSSGQAVFTLRYNKTESILLEVRDPWTGVSPTHAASYLSPNAITFKPGAMASLNLPSTLVLQSNKEITLALVARDVNDNVIPDQNFRFSIVPTNSSSNADIYLNNQPNSLVQKASVGVMPLTIVPSGRANGEYSLIATDADNPTIEFVCKLTILGFPSLPPRAPMFGGNRIPLNTPIFLDLSDINLQGGSLETYYRINNGVYQAYNPLTGIPGFTQHGDYQIDYYSEICYSVVSCTDPVSQLTINGAPLTLTYTTVEEAGKLAVYPNPFNPKDSSDNLVGIQYPLSSNSSVEIDIYDLFGQKVRHIDIIAGAMGGTPDAMGRSTATYLWDGVNDDGRVVANGGYVVVVKIGATGQSMKTKLMVVK